VTGIGVRSANLNQIDSLVDENGGSSSETALGSNFLIDYFKTLFGWLSYVIILASYLNLKECS